MVARPSSLLSRRAVLRLATGVAAGLFVGEAAYGGFYERHHLGVTRCDVPVTGLPPALDGLRVGLITDTHYSAFTSLPFIAKAVGLLNAENPDLVVLGGDYVTHHDRRYIPEAASPFAKLRPKYGVFGVLGNHDDALQVPRALRKAGVTVLNDARTRLTVRGATVDLIGLNYWTRTLPEVARVARGHADFAVLLAHDPRRLREAAALRMPLVLSGHTHGGQVALPVVGAIAAKKYPVAEGLGREGDTALFVSRGVGTVLVPCRVGCPPEVAVVTLKQAVSA